MIGSDLEGYVYALYSVMISLIVGLLIVVRSLRDAERPIAVLKLYNLLFFLGMVGWLSLALRDVFDIALPITFPTAYFFLCSLAMLLATTGLTGITKLTVCLAVAHVACALCVLAFADDQAALLAMSIYKAMIYPCIFYRTYKRALSKKNAGYAITTLALLVPFCSVPVEIYYLLFNVDLDFVFQITFVMNAVAFVMIALGFLSSVLIDERNELTLLALKDPLTGLLNRRGMEYSLKVPLSSALRSHNWTSVIAVDIDDFKLINDTYGHDSGDVVLQSLSQVLMSYTRASDICCRFGGEEFVIIMLDSETSEALKIAERIRQHLQALVIPLEHDSITLTSSFGVAAEHDVESIDSLLKSADEALYAAKRKGKNRVCIAEIAA
ncbi:MAG: GGDEF domain-containing protein [Pseudomonadales bacterium]|nr:GGDEF domain-containing protein [Pseudomonadales bacterium]